jgi:hypothetical protein
MKRSDMATLKVALFLVGLMAATNAFHLPAHNSPAMRQKRPTRTTALGLQSPHRWMFPRLRRPGKNPLLANQSSLTVGQQGFDAPTNGDASPVTAAGLSQTDKAETPVTNAATVTSSTMNLIKVILGTGCLALPNGLAAVSDYPTS